ncbi:purine-cytosine permease [Phytophthora pseudosyringae]|uniref:Purine-cytosine permease n=1 Tax=Phytophthora pseudosyringae TaxID=221518 RepID=A0A8T1V8H4_9STRA|nr:purine-cytosine permease [Phytophthora pseudosyringae]
MNKTDSHVEDLKKSSVRFKIDMRRIERETEDDHHDDSIVNVGRMWLAANMVISSFAIGMLGTSPSYLGSDDAFLVVLFFYMEGILPVCYFHFGHIFGLH